MTAVLEVEAGTESNILAVALHNRHSSGWRTLDITPAVRAAQASQWKLHLKFQVVNEAEQSSAARDKVCWYLSVPQVETMSGNETAVTLVKPRNAIRLSQPPFIVIFAQDEPDFEKDFGEAADMQQPRTRLM